VFFSVVSGLRTECAECQVRSIARGKELRALLSSSNAYGETMARFDVWLGNLETKIDSKKQEAIGDAVDVIDKQIQQHLVCCDKELVISQSSSCE